jgi:alginate production protein
MLFFGWTPHVTSHIRAQAFLSEEKEVPSSYRDPSNAFLSLREFWVAHSGFTSYPGDLFRLGLQRVRAPDGLWWDKEIESVRWVFDTTQLQAHVGVAERFGSYRSDHAKPAVPLRDRTYILTGISRQWPSEHVVGIRGTVAVDHADLAVLGSQVNSSNLQQSRQLNWFSVYAENGFYHDRKATAFSYWVEVMELIGAEDVLQVDSKNHLIGVTPREILSMAGDLGLRVRLPTPFPLQLGIAGAYAQGGGDNGRSHLFVQTGLQSNRSRFTGTPSIINRFNEVFRANLSNIRVATLFLSLPLLQGDASVILSHFERNNVSSPITTTGLSLSPLTNSGQIGNGLDLVLTRRFDAIERATKGDEDLSTHVRLMASLFQPGMLYGNQVHDLYKMMLEVTLWF